MWYDETKKRWYCSNKKCVKYKPQPKPEPEPTPEKPTEGTTTPSEGSNTHATVETPSTGEPVQSDGESATDTSDGGK